MRRLVSFFLGTTFLLQPAAVLAIDIDSLGLTEREKIILFRVCNKVDSDHIERCQSRQLARMGYEGGKSAPVNAFQIYDGMDLGQNHLRRTLMEERRKAFEESRKTRKTYNDYTVPEVSQFGRDYVEQLRYDRLECMRNTRPGRPRSMCLDQLGNKARRLMQEQAGSMKVYTEE